VQRGRDRVGGQLERNDSSRRISPG
jgi:hypothetical protein